MKKILGLGLLLGSMLTTMPVLANSEWTEARTVDAIQVNSGGTYYFKSEQGWGAEGCPTAQMIYIPSGTPGATFFQMALEAKNSAGLKLQAQGSCSDQNHFLINYLVLSN